MRKTYQGTPSKSKRKFELIGKQELLVQVPLPMAEVWEELCNRKILEELLYRMRQLETRNPEAAGANPNADLACQTVKTPK